MNTLIVANWKMNPQTLSEAKQLFSSIDRELRDIRSAEIVICPPFVYLSSFKSSFKFQISTSKIGVQDCFWEQKGAFTGEISPAMLKDLGCQYVIIGHSERRKYFQETDEMINKKMKAVISIKLNPILCVGETLEEREQGRTKYVLKKQIVSAFKNISSSQFFSSTPKFGIKSRVPISKIYIAYEPIWAIGTGKSCEIDKAKKVNLLIQEIVAQLYSSSVAENFQVLYGGSVNSKNAASYLKEAEMNGLLVGGASLDPLEFVKIVKASS